MKKRNKGCSRIVNFDEKKIAFLLVTSRRARRLRVVIKPGGEMIVTKPAFLDEAAVERFLRRKSHWIIDKIDYLRDFQESPLSKAGKQEYLKHKEAAMKLAEEKVRKLNGFYGFRVNRIVVRNQKTRWGSCSKNGNLSFNFRIALLPEYMVDYIVVHELCHLGQMNHSQKFWDLVSKTVPNYFAIRKELKNLY